MSTASDFLLFAATAALMTLNQRGIAGASPLPDAAAKTCDADTLKNSAFVFVKPQANTPATQALVKSKLMEAGITILSEADIDGTVIDEKKLIDQHYFAIASKATILPAKDIPVPTAKFQESFGESWQQVLEEDRACNAMDACKRFACSAVELNDAWQKAKVVKFGGGFYCGTTKMKNENSESLLWALAFMEVRVVICLCVPQYSRDLQTLIFLLALCYPFFDAPLIP
jgi:hypothetical protein